MRFALLGPLTVTDRFGGRVALPGARQRVLLAALLVRANVPVSADTLADEVWDGSPPPGAADTLRSHISRLRRLLGPEAGAWIAAHQPGYLIRVSPAELDLLEFEEHCRDAGAALRRGSWADASDAAARALALWRAEPLLDVPSQGLRDAILPRLGHLRLQVLEDRGEADLRLGRHDALVPRLRELTARHPLRERFHGQLMQALAGVGRQAEALEAYQHARKAFVDDLGIEPGPELQELHQRILAGDPSLVAPAQAPGAPGPAAEGRVRTLVPRQLPRDVAYFTGRADALETLNRIAGESAAGSAIAAISGTAGVGKTAFATRWAHQHADQFPDGQLHLNLRGFDPAGVPMTEAAALRRLLDGLGVPQNTIPVDLDAQSALYRSLLAEKRMLVVLDNARDAGQVRPLLPGSAGCTVLVTSRDQLLGLAALDGAHLIMLRALAPDEARELLARRLGARRLAADPAAASRLVDLCAGLPLALNIAAARLAAVPDAPLATVADQLRRTRGRLGALDAGDAAANMRAVLSWSYRTLGANAARTFRLLAEHVGPDITASAAASLTATSSEQAHEAISELTRAHLLTEHAPGRYSFANGLLLSYACELSHAEESGDERRSALLRVLDHYVHSARNAVSALETSPMPAAPSPAPGVSPEQFPDSKRAREWLDAEHPVLVAATLAAAQADFDAQAWHLAVTVAAQLGRGRRWHDLADVLTVALESARRLGDLAGEALLHRYLGLTLAGLRAYGEARTHLDQALGLAQRSGDRAAQADTCFGLAYLLRRQGRYDEALTQIGDAMELAEGADDKVRCARALNETGLHHILNGRHEQALPYCRQALDLLDGVGNQSGEPWVWFNLGLIHEHLGRLGTAIECYTTALDLFRAARERHDEVDTLVNLGNACAAAGEQDRAHDAWVQALAILDDLEHPEAGRLRESIAACPRRIDLKIV